MIICDHGFHPRLPRQRHVGACLCVALIVLYASHSATADDWPFFRGPHFDGTSHESDWVSAWPRSGPKIAWRKQLGLGVSSFAVVGDRALTMSQQGDVDTIWCLHASDGRELWKFEYPCKYVDHFFENGTLSTPTVDGSSVFAVAYDGQLHCLDLRTGKLHWRKHLIDDFGGRQSSWDYAGSPLVAGERLIVETGAEGKSTVALNKANGELVWGAGDDLTGYASPIPCNLMGTDAVLVFKARAMIALRLADGQELWRIPWKTKYDVNASSPIVQENLLLISSGYGGRRARGALFRLEQPEPQQLWVNDDIETKMNSAVMYQGHIYCISERDGGQLMCVHQLDGSTVWVESSFGQYGALILVDDKLVIQDERGDVVIASASSDRYRELARATVLDRRCWVQPVLANGRLFLRNNKGRIVCLDLRRQP